MNAYEVLGVAETATRAEIREAFQRAILRTHPDQAGPGLEGDLDLARRAWALLGDPDARRAYDDRLRASRAMRARPVRPTRRAAVDLDDVGVAARSVARGAARAAEAIARVGEAASKIGEAIAILSGRRR